MELRLPFVTIVHCNSDALWPSDESSGDMASAYRAAKVVFCVSRHNLELLECQIGEALTNSQIVWNPFNVPGGEPTAWPANDGIWKLACVGRLDPGAKGQDLLFHTLSQPQWSGRPVEINLYGSGPCENSLRRLMKKLKLRSVHFHGYTNDVKAVWAQNHLLVLPSRFEGLPLALVEAMWCGRPAVVTDIGGNAELCVDGETGYVAAAPAVSLVAETMERAWNDRDRWQNMGVAAGARVRSLLPKDPVGDFCEQLGISAAAIANGASPQRAVPASTVPIKPIA
jgi:glycosyltransferase involved in cell wall biosynthesis